MLRIIGATDERERQFAGVLARREGVSPDHPVVQMAVVLLANIARKTQHDFLLRGQHAPVPGAAAGQRLGRPAALHPELHRTHLRKRTTMSTTLSTKAGGPAAADPETHLDHLLRPHRRNAALQPRPDHRLHRHAHHRRQARRRRAPGLDHHGLPAGHHHRHADLREVRRHPGPPEPLPRGDRPVHPGLGGLRLRDRFLGLRHLPRRPGPGRRWPDDPLPGHHRRHRARQGPRQVHGPARRDLRPLRRRRPAAGRLLRGPPDLGMGLLHQHPHRHRRVHHRLVHPDAAQQEGRKADRYPRRAAALRGHHLPDLLHRLRRQEGRRLGFTGHLGLRRRRASLPPPPSSWWSAGPRTPSSR